MVGNGDTYQRCVSCNENGLVPCSECVAPLLINPARDNLNGIGALAQESAVYSVDIAPDGAPNPPDSGMEGWVVPWVWSLNPQSGASLSPPALTFPDVRIHYETAQ